MKFIELENGQVLIERDFNTFIEKKHYDMKYHTKLTYNDNDKKVIAKIYNYLNEFQENYNDEVIFEYEGNELTVQAKNGVAEIDFEAYEGLECTVRTKVPNFRNGEVTFVV